MPTLLVALLALTLALPAAAIDLPKRKPGLWEVKSQGDAGPKAEAQAMQMCIDAQTEKAAQGSAAGFGMHSCAKQDLRREGPRLVMDSVCKFGETTATTRAVFTGSFDASYKVETHSTYDPPLMGMKEGRAVIEARWLGPCKPDQKPGDMILGNGMKINMNHVKAK